MLRQSRGCGSGKRRYFASLQYLQAFVITLAAQVFQIISPRNLQQNQALGGPEPGVKPCYFLPLFTQADFGTATAFPAL
jgi:hypothetical protein